MNDTQYTYLELHKRPELFPQAAKIIFDEWHIELAKYHNLYTMKQVESYIYSLPCFATLLSTDKKEEDQIINITLIEEKDWIVDIPLGPWLSNIIIDKIDEHYTPFLNFVISWFRSNCYEFTLYCWSFDQVVTNFYSELGFCPTKTLLNYKGIDKVVILSY